MKEFKVITIVDGEPTFAVPLSEIFGLLKRGGAIRLLDPTEYITERQRRWYEGVCLRDLVKNDENGETREWWDKEVKSKCGGLTYLKKEIFFLDNGEAIGRLTTKGVGKKNMTLFIEEILSKAMQYGWPVSPPDADLRKK